MAGGNSSRSPWKRSACDRCRGQKLRCPRDEGQSTDACLRCLKSGAKCVTSMARPTGRPPSQQQPRVDPTSGSSSQTSNSSADNNSSNGADTGMVDLDYDMFQEDFLDSISIHHDINACLFSQLTSPHSTSLDIGPQPRTGGDLDSSHRTASDQFSGIPVGMASPTDPALSASTDCAEMLLSNLHSDLCGQLCSIRSVPWDVKGTLNLSFSQNGIGAELESSDSHPLVQVSKASTELESLLVTFRPPGMAAKTPLTLPHTSGPSCLRTAQLLVALSCYIQIVSIYDVIFTKVLEYLGSSQRTLTAATSAESAPTLYLGGLPIPPNHKLSGSLLVHLIEHQLQQIELLMGLPEHYRISSSSKHGMDGAIGLFKGHHCQSLLNAVIRLGEDPDGNHDDTRCVRSLKLKMTRIKDL